MHPAVEKLLSMDVYLTDQFVKAMEKLLVFRQLRTHYKLLEVGKFDTQIPLIVSLILLLFISIFRFRVMACYGSHAG